MRMQSSRRDFFKLAGGAVAAATLGEALIESVSAFAAETQRSASSDPALHLLNRLSYGVLPEDMARLSEIGLAAYLEEQLAPETLDDSGMDDILRQLPILAMDRRTIFSLGFDGRVYNSVIQGMVFRAAWSRRQLYERMVEFWTDHFNIPAEDLVHDVAVLHHAVIRRHALGSFRDLVIGTAQSPAMLYYLDQTYSDKDHPNENYARVDGGYTETDVKEAARALTGWTVHDGTNTGFHFNPEMHDSEAKTILGHDMPAGRGIEDGLHLISIVVNHHETARFLCKKLCIRFVSDTPPESLVESATQIWIDNAGEVIPVLRHIFQSDEFAQSAGQKLRRPLDFIVGALRITHTRFSNPWQMHEMLKDLAQTPYGWTSPDGYPDTATAWLSSSGLLARWNAAMSLTHDAYSDPESGLSNRLDQLIDSPQTVQDLIDTVATRVFGAPDLSDAEQASYVAFVGDGAGASASVTPKIIAGKLGMLFGLMLASPRYQWR
jgi:hypothetical protein